jgi:predicted acyl esterase
MRASDAGADMTTEFTRIEPAPVDPAAEPVMVRTRDGVGLAADLYLPARASRHPTVLVRLPYDKCGRYTFMPQVAPLFTERGYAFVVQDVRGKFRSEGPTVPYVHEAGDGYDTIDWIVAQPWSDGKVGMFGDSYYGFTQWAAVASGHPALRAIVPRVTSVSIGTVRLGTRWDEGVQVLYGADYFAHYWLDRFIYEFEVDWSHRPLAEVFDQAFRAVGARSAAVDELVADARGKSAFDPFRGGHPFDRLRIPVLHAGGWFDNLAPDQMRDYMTLQRRGHPSSPQHLIMDSTDHENYHLDLVPITPERDHDSDDAALARMLPSYVGPALEFFDHYLRGLEGPALPAVRWHHGHVGWQAAVAWPPPGATELRLHLSDGRQATGGPEGGGLSVTPDRAPADATWTHDPDDLVPSTVGDPFAFLHEYPDERDVERRQDVMTFTTDELETPLDLAGPVSATLRVTSTAASTALFAKVLDVFPDGTSRMLQRGQALERDAADGGMARVELGHLGYRVQAGHRLRLHVASSDFPLYLWHPGTTENPWTASSGTPSEQRLRTGGSDGSSLTLWTHRVPDA